jgi:lipopolysaccharide biosynthesis glycosyltransferase
VTTNYEKGCNNLKNINVLLAADENYADQLQITIKTTLENLNKKTRVNFIVLSNNLSSATMNALEKLAHGLHSVEYLDLDPTAFNFCPTNSHINKTAYYRIVAPKLLAKRGLDRIVYLDVDLLVRHDLTELYNCELNGNIIGAVIDTGQAFALDRLGVDPVTAASNIYFNSGILVIDIQKWNKHHITEKTLNYIKTQSQRIIFHDQDALNAVLAGKVQMLHPKWNLQNSIIFRKHRPINEAYAQLINEAIKNPAIVHFTTHEKPWKTLSEHPYLAEYHEELNELEMQRGVINVISAANSAFIEPLATSYISILENDSENQYNFYLLPDHLEHHDMLLLGSVISRYDNATIQIVEVNEDLLANAVESDRILKSAYYRILAPELLPAVKRAIYLDCDIICNTNLHELWQTSLEGNVLAAVEDAGFHDRLEHMGITRDNSKYFNSGMMLIDLVRWRSRATTQRVLDYINNNPEKLRFHDQDALNAILHDSWLHLHPQWNAQSNIIFDALVPPRTELLQPFAEARANPKLIHFCGHVKPWHDDSTHPYTDVYLKYHEKLRAPVQA